MKLLTLIEFHMASESSTPKTVIEIDPEVHEVIKAFAKTRGIPVKKASSLLLGYAMMRLNSGRAELTGPTVVDK
tara:strand:- start:11998 stop:12219 length:222 start_codon:yes stop_codon:yes gene_type:complete